MPTISTARLKANLTLLVQMNFKNPITIAMFWLLSHPIQI